MDFRLIKNIPHLFLTNTTSINTVVTGKPAIAFFQAAADLLGEQDDIVMIGDDIPGDIEASQHAGLKAIQVRTGKFTERIFVVAFHRMLFLRALLACLTDGKQIYKLLKPGSLYFI